MTREVKVWPTEPLAWDCEVPEAGEGHAWIQWKGTDACMDVHCKCGVMGHVDAEFAYFYLCPGCKQTFCVGQTVRLYPIAPDKLAEVAHPNCTVTSCLEPMPVPPEPDKP